MLTFVRSSLILVGCVVASVHGYTGSWSEEQGLFKADFTTEGDMITITMTKQEAVAGEYVSVGFHTSQWMLGADYLIGWVDEAGAAHGGDYHTYGGPSPPTNAHMIPLPDDYKDSGGKNDPTFSGSLVDGTLTFSFTRPINGDDDLDHKIDFEQSVVQFAWGNGAKMEDGSPKPTGVVNLEAGELTSDLESLAEFGAARHDGRDYARLSCIAEDSTVAEADCAFPAWEPSPVEPALPAFATVEDASHIFQYLSLDHQFGTQVAVKNGTMHIHMLYRPPTTQGTDRYVSIGFNNDDGIMAEADYFMAMLGENGDVAHFDGYMPAFLNVIDGHQNPSKDTTDDYTSIEGGVTDGVISVSAQRAVTVSEEGGEDVVPDFDEGYLLVAWGGFGKPDKNSLYEGTLMSVVENGRAKHSFFGRDGKAWKELSVALPTEAVPIVQADGNSALQASPVFGVAIVAAFVAMLF